jgi:hypothetical protein
MLVISSMDGERCINDVYTRATSFFDFLFVEHCHAIEFEILVSCYHVELVYQIFISKIHIEAY